MFWLRLSRSPHNKDAGIKAWGSETAKLPGKVICSSGSRFYMRKCTKIVVLHVWRRSPERERLALLTKMRWEEGEEKEEGD